MSLKVPRSKILAVVKLFLVILLLIALIGGIHAGYTFYTRLYYQDQNYEQNESKSIFIWNSK